RQDTVGLGSDKVWHICDAQSWRSATTYEKDTYRWVAGNDGDSKWGSVNGKNCYVFEEKAWRAGNNSDCSLELRGCTTLRQDTVGLGSDKVWHICDAQSWRNATDIEKDTATWGEKFTEGDVRNGSVNTSFTYVFNGSNWRRGTILDSLMVKNGGLACAEKKNTTNGKIAVYKDTSSVKIGNLYYVCSSGTATLADTTYRWMVAPNVYNDTYESRGECANATDGDLMQGRISNTKIYVCDFNDSDKDGEKGWESASMVESVIGGCRSRQQDSVGLAKGVYYYCNEGTWRLASTLEYDTYHWNDTIDGAWKKGSVVNSNIYVFDESEGAWRTSTTGFDTLSINGCTVKRQLERANIYDEDNETNHCYTCYNKKWYDGNEWSWDLPKEAYLNPEVEYDTIIDARDGKSYKTVKIGDQVWMAENLNYADSNQTPSLKGKSWCYDNNEKYCDVTGRLYTWAAAIDSVALANDSNNPQKCGNGKTCTLSTVVQGVCPSGWHLPSEEEWNLLFTNVGDKHVGKMLKSMNGWENGGNDDNAYGFSALPAGIRYNDGYFRDAGDDAYFWSASEYNSFGACRMLLYYDSEYAYMYYLNKNDGFSVRCLQDN
ncbi:MAG: fibrobacter succinogenes major paralogous domain-containing protein, partial [Fibrobacter sp.]|nr:fibrobacter succinogenes major paralogous domain-containing protein [Fibrobacter sp.]